MRTFFATLLVLGVLGMAPAALAQSSHEVSVVVPTFSFFEVDANDVTITLDSPTDGTGLAAKTASSSYDISTNAQNMKIIGKIDEASGFPSDLSLDVTFSAASAAGSGGSGGTPSSNVVLSTTDQDIITGISYASGDDVGITYRATPSAAMAPGTYTRTITYTLTTGS